MLLKIVPTNMVVGNGEWKKAGQYWGYWVVFSYSMSKHLTAWEVGP